MNRKNYINIQHEHLAFDAIFKKAPLLKNSRSRTILRLLEIATGSKMKERTEVIEEIDRFITSLEYLVEKVKIAKEKYLIELEETQEDYIKRLKENDKQYTTTSAGIYIASKLNRKSAYTRAQVNNFINDGKLSSDKPGTKNIIYESDIDKFIEIYKDTMKGISKN
jgi:hypothetical protein